MMMEIQHHVFVEILHEGGPLMIPLTTLAFSIYFEGFRQWFTILQHPLYRKFSQHVLSPSLMTWLSQHHNLDLKTLSPQQLSARLSGSIHALERRVLMLSRFVKSGPLLGLLGTVMGMMGTFEGIMGTGLDQSEDIAAGVSQALLTTQYGLLISIPGILLLANLKSGIRKLQRQSSLCQKILSKATEREALR